jgi:UDP-2,3-diacylglucosamine hydrolase
MSISVISDIHITHEGDLGTKLLSDFLEHSLVQNSNTIIFLGDIFDIMVGGHKEYIEMYPTFFTGVQNLINAGKEVLYFEGNHDLHLENTFNKIFSKNFELITTNKIITHKNKSIYFSHDDIELDNTQYRTFISVMRSVPFKFLLTKLIPLSYVKYLGEKASSASRKYSSNPVVDKYVEKTFRRSARVKAMDGHDFIISGHSHIKDLFKFKIKDRNCVYANCGYLKKSKTFIHIDTSVELISLVDSSL